MGLRMDPVGGGQFQRLVQELIQAERQPIRALEEQRQIQEAKLQLFREFKNMFGTLQGSLSEIGDFQKLKELKVDLGDGEDLVDVTLDKETARPGTYEIEIEELAKRSAMISNGFEDPDKPVMGIGYIVVSTDDEVFEIFVDDEDASLRRIARMINETPNSPVQAEVVEDVYYEDTPWRLIVKSKTDGTRGEVDFPEFYFLGGREDFWVEDDTEPDNAYLIVDGFEIEAASNDISDFVEGVNLHLKNSREGNPFTMTISVDYEAVSGKVKKFVEDTNKVLEFINLQNSVDERTDTTATFTGDSGLQNIEYRIRNLMHEGFPAGDPDSDRFQVVHLNQVGVSFNREGSLTFDENKFNKALEDNFDAIAEALTGEYGFGYQMGEVLKMYTRPFDGLLQLKERGLQSRIESIDNQIETKERFLDRKAENITNRFARLQSSLGALQQQQQYLQSTLGASGGNVLSQLLGG